MSGTGRAVTAVVVAVLVAVVAFGAYAFAQPDREGPPWMNGIQWHDGDRGRGGWHGGGWGPDPERVLEERADLASDLATELDTSVEEVEAAFRAVVAARLQEAVDAGDLDEAAAEDALTAYDEGDVGTLFRVFKHGRRETTEGS